MKNSLLVPVRFVLTFLVVTFLLSGTVALAEWLGFSDPARDFSLHPIAFFVAAFKRTIVLGVALTMLVRLMRLHARPGIPIVSLFFTLVTSACVIFGSFWLARFVQPDAFGPSATAGHAPVSVPIPVNVLNRSGDSFLFVSRAEDGVLKDVVAYSPDDEPRLAFSREARTVDGRVILPDAGPTFALPDIETAPWAFVRPPRVLSGISRDSLSVSAVLDRSVISPRFASAAAGFSVALLGAWAFLRWTRWPLLNVVLATAYVRGVLFVPVILSDEIAEELLWPVLPSWAPAYGSAAVWGAVGLALLATTVLMRPYRTWRKDVIDE